MSIAFKIIKRACCIKMMEDGLSDGEALERAILEYNPFLLPRLLNEKADPRTNLDQSILFLVNYFETKH